MHNMGQLVVPKVSVGLRYTQHAPSVKKGGFPDSDCIEYSKGTSTVVVRVHRQIVCRQAVTHLEIRPVSGRALLLLNYEEVYIRITLLNEVLSTMAHDFVFSS